MNRAAQAVTIVMVEDDDGHARLIERNLRRAGVSNEVRHFSTGQAAMDHLLDGGRAEAPLLLLLDLNLPDMDGAVVLQRLKADPALKSAPVIVLTTTDDPREIQRCYELGCNVYITKPVNYDTFAEAIRQLGLFLSVIQIPAS